MRNRGFTLLETVLCMWILTCVLVGLISLYIYCFDLQDTSGNTSNVLFQAQEKLEEIINSSLTTQGFNSIVDVYDAQTSPLEGINGQIYTEILKTEGSDCAYPLGEPPASCDLYNVRIVAGWVQKAGRIFGEGRLNENGDFVFDDTPPYGDDDGTFESPVVSTTAVARR